MLKPTTLVIASFAVALACQRASQGAIAYYQDLTSFESTNSHLTVENFESARTQPGSYTPLGGALVPGVTSEAFGDKGLKPGFSIAAVGEGDNHQLVVVGPQTTPNATRGVGVVASGNAMEISFNAASAVGMNLLASSGPGKLGHGKFRVTIYGDKGEIGKETVAVEGTSTFFGISAGKELIRRISIVNVDTGDSVFVDNLTFAGKGDSESDASDDGEAQLPGPPDDIAGGGWGSAGPVLGSSTPDGRTGMGMGGIPDDVGTDGSAGGSLTDGGAGGGSPPPGDSAVYNPHMPPGTIPEPATPAMLALGLAALASSRRDSRGDHPRERDRNG